jgi:hypothetical protein
VCSSDLTEGANRIHQVLKEKQDAITNSPKYIHFENEFVKSTLGQNFACLSALAKDIDKEMLGKKYDLRYCKLQEHVEERKKNYLAWLKLKIFPTPSDDFLIPAGFLNSKGWYSTSIQEYLYHQLSIVQLTKGSKEITELLDKLVKELVAKIK